MKSFYFLLTPVFLGLAFSAFSQCPPPGFPSPGNSCPTAPILCENLDGYCSTINNSNIVQNFPGCNNNVLNNDEWFGFFAGSTTISIQITPSNCNPGPNQGLQGAIYDGCGPPWTWMDLQCACSTAPFTLTSTNFVVGQVYWIVLDGCGGNVCDFDIAVTQGSTVAVPPDNPGPISGPDVACAGQSSNYGIDPVSGATIYNWTITPASAGTLNTNGPNATVNWSNNPGTAEICVSPANLCEVNSTTSCFTVDVLPIPTATLSGSGLFCAGMSGSVDLTVTFTGTGPWEFVHTIGGAAQPAILTSDNPYTLTVTQPGTVALQSVTSGNGACTGTVSGSVTLNEININPTTAVTNAICGNSNGSVNLSMGGGNAPFMFIWSNGETTEDLNNVPPGTYTVTITDNNGCEATTSATVGDDPVAITVTGTVVNNTTCIGGNGSITTNVSPAGTYTYNWSNGETTPNLNNLEPGTYILTVTLGVNCTGTASFTVDDDPNEPMVTFTTVQSTCDLDNGSIDVSVSGGVPPYTYLWGDGSTSQDLTNIPAGTYDLTVTGANGCTGTANVSVTNNNPPITINGTVVANTTCLPPGNGSITLNVQPPGSYTYLWGGGETTPNLSNLPPGTYVVTVSAGGSCTAEASFTIDDNPDEPNVTFTVVQSTCNLNNGSIDVSVSGGVAPYTYIWGDGTTTQDLSNIPTGTYDLTVTGANGCTGTANINVPNNDPPITINATVQPNTSCLPPGNGSITLNVQPGGSYTYIWSGGQTTPNLSNLPPGTYTVTVSAGGTCTAEASFTIDDNPNLPTINFTTVPSTCDLSNGSIDVSVSGGVPPYTYLWSNNATTQDLTNIPAGNYGLTVTGANGCSSTASIDVTNNNPPINIGATVNPNTGCTISNGSIILNVNPPGSYTYLWSNSATTPNISNLAPGVYTVTVSGTGSCSNTASFLVPDIPSPPDLVLTPTNPICEQNNGSIDLSVFGGVPPFTYLWSNNATTQDLNNLPAGGYSVTVTGANGCSNEASTFLDNDYIPIALAGEVTPQTSCVTNNGAIQLDLDPPNLSILWSNSSTQPNLTNLAPGTYTVTVSAGGVCTETATFVVDDAAEPPVLFINVTPATCGFANGEIDLEAFNGVEPYTYNWSHLPGSNNPQDPTNLPAGGYAVTVTSAVGCTSVLIADVPGELINIEIFGAAVDNYSCTQPNGFIDIDVYPPGFNYMYQWSTFQSSEDISNLPAGTYTVTVTLGVGCSAVATYDLIDNIVPINVSLSSNPAICGQTNGSISLSANGGSAPYTFLWSTTATSQNLTNLAPGTYTVTVSDFFDCTSTASATVSNTNIAVNITGTTTENTSCSAANGGVNITASPVAPYTYTWSNTATTEDLGNVPAGTYTVTVNAGGGCSSTASFTVLNNTSDPVISPAVTASICGLDNGAIDLTVSDGTAPYTYLWSNSATTEDLNGILAGNYTVTVTDANGCTADTTLNVPNNASTFSLTGTTVALTSCLAPNGSIDLTVTPAGSYTYLWSNSATTEDISNLPDGTYTVSVTESGDCTASASFVVSNNLTYPALSQAVTPELCGLADGAIDLSVTGGAMPYTFLWSGTQMTEDLANISTGSYTVTVIGANGCSATTSATVPENTINFSIAGLPAANTSCVASNGSVDITLTPAAPGAGPGYSFIWSTTATTEDLTNLAPGTYTVTVSAGGTCTNVASYSVTNNALPPTISESVGLALCGQSSGSINLTLSGGNGPFTFQWSNTATTEDINGLPPGTYTVTVTGVNGCSAIKTFTVLEDVVTPNISAVPTANSSCLAANGAITLSLTPASLTYTYAWAGGQATQNLTGLAPGDYTVTVNGGGSCTNTATISVGNNIQPPVITDTVLAALCGQNSGSINLNVSVGNPPFTYLWSNNAMLEDLVGVASGTYSVTVTGANGCTSTASYTIPEDTVIPDITGSTVPNSSCVVDNGNITTAVSPATLTYTYAWAGGQNTANLNDLPPGTYTVTVNGGGACSNTASFTVGDVSGAPTVTGTTVDILCFGANTGAIDLTITGGAAPYVIKWTPDIPGSPEDPTGLLAGNYSVEVTDTAGCATTVNFAINQPAAAVQLACAQSSNVTMPGATDGAASVTISGGIAPYTITWSPGSTQGNVPTGPFAIDNLGVGDYDVTVTDANGCPVSCNFNISIINCETKLGIMQGNTLSLCGTGCQTANYNNIGQFLEPGDVLQFILHEGSGTQIVNELARSDQPTFCFDPASMNYGTTYYISAAAGNDDGTGNVQLSHFCTVVAAGTPVIFQEKPVASAADPGPLNCAVSQVPIAGTSDIPGSIFQWSTANGQIIGSAAQATANAGAAGLYTLIVGANGCADTTAVTVDDLTNDPKAEIVASPNSILDCSISEIILSGDIKGTSDANSVWLYNGASYAVGTVLTIDAPGIYEFIILDTLTFCSDTALIEINENLGYPPLSITPPGTLNCISSSVTLSGGSSISGIQFNWASVVGADTTVLGSGATIGVTTPGTYVLIGTDPVSHCVNSLGTQVNADFNYPVASAGAPFSIACYGETAYLDGSGTTGAAGLTYAWTTPDGYIAAGATTAAPEINQPGTYNLLVTNPGNGCTDTDQVVIDPEDPVAVLDVVQPPCEGDRGRIIIDTVIGGQPPLNYSINNGQTFTTQSFFGNLPPGDYTILVQDANGCETTASATILEPEVFEVMVEPQVTIKLGGSYQIETTVSVPLSDLSLIQWTPPLGLDCDTCLNPLASPLQTTRYRITVISNKGCEDDASLLLVVDRRPNVYIPNAFSPNGDGDNDLFKIYADPISVKQVKTFQVFSRWGELVYEYYNFDPNSPAYGWDGTLRGQQLNPAVFAYYAVIEFIDGQEILYEGDVTIVR
ncbi:MAG: gliding motility-associated C-terminal domain-containing protein [Lewinellaceae bacterium]|nr:gliding motility-associated C-terminal domain-containing protein [Lewinellaceae bacterium]